MEYEDILRAHERLQLDNRWEIERNFKPYYAFPRRSNKKEIEAFDEDDDVQTVLEGAGPPAHTNLEGFNLGSGDLSTPTQNEPDECVSEEKHSRAYLELSNFLVWNGLSIERFWLIYGR